MAKGIAERTARYGPPKIKRGQVNQKGSRRLRERLSFSLPLRVRARESQNYEWSEMTRSLDLTPFGARFLLRHPTERGRLLHLTIPMPRQLRCFDHTEPQYRVWALVRHVQPRLCDGGETRFEVGVAFIGKRPPESFLRDPTCRYEPKGSETEGMLSVTESVDERAERTRLHLPVEVVVELFDDDAGKHTREETVTENISPEGAAVFTTLEIERGRFVRVRDARRPDFVVTAVVRARRVGADHIARLHLEFVDGKWPIEGLG